jgi:hypothetical protein
MTKTLEEVRAEADALGIEYHHRAGVKTIQSLIDDINPPAETERKWILPTQKVQPLSEKQFRELKFQERKKKAGSLVRCRIANMNPEKREWTGEFISAGSAKLGTFTKFIPFNNPEPYHIPQIIYDVLKDKECSIFFEEKNKLGGSVKRARSVKEYSIDVLPPLTRKEIDELARQQRLAKGQE